MFAALDESAPELPSGIAYVLTGVVLLGEEVEARKAAQAVLPTYRKNPFHWHREGPTARDAMMACLSHTGAVAHVCVHYPTGRRKQEAARARLLEMVVPKLLGEGAGHLCIESRGSDADLRDRVVLLDLLNPAGGSAAMSYDWRNKSEPLLWLADGVCGAAADYLRQAPGTTHYFETLQASKVIGELTYIGEGAP